MLTHTHTGSGAGRRSDAIGYSSGYRCCVFLFFSLLLSDVSNIWSEMGCERKDFRCDNCSCF